MCWFFRLLPWENLPFGGNEKASGESPEGFGLGGMGKTKSPGTTGEERLAIRGTCYFLVVTRNLKDFTPVLKARQSACSF
jgi:hypothetical protein